MLILPPSAPVLTPDTMRRAESATILSGVPALLLMERAAAAAARVIGRFAPGIPILVLCGPGNNGGDGYGVAALLTAAGHRVRVASASPARSAPALTMAARWTAPVEALADCAPAPLIVDALYGTGLARVLPDDIQAALDRLQKAKATVIALDIPSGIDARNGDALGRPLAADLTIAFGALKCGHVLGAGAELSGRIVIADIGLGEQVASLHLVPPPLRTRLAPDVHKYRRGSVLVIEGSPNRGGAAQLTALAALRAGAGAVTLVGEGNSIPANAIMRRSDAEGLALLFDTRTTAIAIGPGLADHRRSRDWLARILAGTIPAVIDAGALALMPPSRQSLPVVLTPHEGEFARLFGAPGPDRVAAALAAAGQTGAVVVLKGPQTIIAAPNGQAAVNTHATPWLASAGSGDVLTGIIAALLAQGMPPFEAACAGTWVHGDAGLRGGIGLIADDLPALLPQVLAGLRPA